MGCRDNTGVWASSKHVVLVRLLVPSWPCLGIGYGVGHSAVAECEVCYPFSVFCWEGWAPLVVVLITPDTGSPEGAWQMGGADLRCLAYRCCLVAAVDRRAPSRLHHDAWPHAILVAGFWGFFQPCTAPLGSVVVGFFFWPVSLPSPPD